MICNKIMDCVGNTPIINLQRISNGDMGNIYVKLEEFNPGGSVKSRISFQMVLDAEKKGILKPNSDQTLLEPTGGNTGIGLAIAGAVRGYRVILVIPDNYSKEKIKVLEAYGAKVILSDHTDGQDSHIKKAKEILKRHPSYIWLDQLSNPSNVKAHYEGTGNEIVNDFKSQNLNIDAFAVGMGSSGTLTGASQRIKDIYPNTRIYCVQPEGYDVFNEKYIFHKIQGWGIGMIPPIFDKNVVDEVIYVTHEEANYYQKELAKNEGLFVGISSGGNVAAAIKIARTLDSNKNVVTVAPDGGISYLDAF